MERIETAEAIGALDLRAEAAEALGRGDVAAVYHERRPYAEDPSITVETVIIGGRAGQVVNGDAMWGDWRERAARIVLDSGELVRLDGRILAPCRHPLAARLQMAGSRRESCAACGARCESVDDRCIDAGCAIHDAEVES